MSDAGHNHYLPEQMFDDWRNAAKDPAVVHFASGRKPWVQDYGQFVDCGCWDMEFWRYASHTPYLNDLIGWIKSPEYKTYVTHKLGIA
jgi:lipopolysaccharide biosynthesis glycosyltransferase